jgi:hypothetical protein
VIEVRIDRLMVSKMASLEVSVFWRVIVDHCWARRGACLCSGAGSCFGDALQLL